MNLLISLGTANNKKRYRELHLPIPIIYKLRRECNVEFEVITKMNEKQMELIQRLSDYDMNQFSNGNNVSIMEKIETLEARSILDIVQYINLKFTTEIIFNNDDSKKEPAEVIDIHQRRR